MAIDHDIPTLVDALIVDAVRDRASDIHVEPGPGETRVRFRVDGLLIDHASHDNTTGRGIVNRLMVMAKLLTYRLDVPQEGRATFEHGNKPLDLRIAIMPTTHGLRAAVRLPADLTQPKSLDALALDARTMSLIDRYIRSDAGALLIVGPAGSGKTTAAYAILEAIRDRSPGTSIVTLEDPVERQLPGITQIPVTPFGQLTYATALRSMLRQDPQVLMLGEIRDADTASIAMQAALSGHRMLCTFHASDPASAIMRLIEMGVEPYQVASSVAGVISMRLLRKRSNGGYAGRVALCESVAVDDPMRAILRREVDAPAIRRVYSSADHHTLAQSGANLVAAGVTDEAEVARVLGLGENRGQG